ncbi:MAG: FAD-binding protein [Alphaproteobacteria bacterium]|nr:FAD-binding protein [Alphaproteobacteria bacterium]
MQPLIIGGGLAGCAAAIDLARAGLRPCLIERNPDPHDKICGEFLSGEAVAALVGLGVAPLALGAVPITRVELWAGRRQAAARLPFPALSLSRRVLDAALVAKAASSVAEFHHGVTALHIGGGRVRTPGGDLRAAAIMLASGKHDVRGQPRPPGPDQIGLKQYFAAPRLHRELAGTVRVVFFDGGYAGLQPVEGGRLNLCLIADGPLYRDLGGWPALLALLLREPGLAALGEGEALLARPLAIARVPYGHLARPAGDGLWRLGDQAAVIPSFCGDGMGIALTSGRLAAELLAAGAGADRFQAELLARTRRPVGLAMAALRLARFPLGRLAALAGLAAIPGALGLLARLTRVADPNALAPAA